MTVLIDSPAARVVDDLVAARPEVAHEVLRVIREVGKNPELLDEAVKCIRAMFTFAFDGALSVADYERLIVNAIGGPSRRDLLTIDALRGLYALEQREGITTPPGQLRLMAANAREEAERLEDAAAVVRNRADAYEDLATERATR